MSRELTDDGSNAASAEDRVDRSVFEIRDSFDDRDDCIYWWAREPEERLRHVERLRRLNHGDRATERLQRVLEIAELPRR